MTKSSAVVDTVRTVVTLALLCLAVLPASPALAAPTSQAAQDRLARLHFEAGKQAYELGRFADAAIEFQRGYDLSHLPLFLLNLGHAYFALDRFDDSIAACQQYLAAKPSDAVHVREAGELLTSAQRHKQLQAPTTPPAEVTPTPPPVTAEPTPPPSEPASPPPARHQGPRRPALAWTGVVGIVLGAGAVAGGAALLVVANNLNNDFNHPAPGTVYDHGTVTRFQTDHNAGVGLVAAGGVLLVAGTVAAILGWRGGREASTSAWWAPSLAPSALAATSGFRF
jgi:hypothetical protein